MTMVSEKRNKPFDMEILCFGIIVIGISILVGVIVVLSLLLMQCRVAGV